MKGSVPMKQSDIKKVRDTPKMKQRELGLALGVSDPEISLWEAGKRKTPERYLRLLGVILHHEIKREREPRPRYMIRWSCPSFCMARNRSSMGTRPM